MRREYHPGIIRYCLTQQQAIKTLGEYMLLCYAIQNGGKDEEG